MFHSENVFLLTFHDCLGLALIDLRSIYAVLDFSLLFCVF